MMKLLLLCVVLAGVSLESQAHGWKGCKLYGKAPAKSSCCSGRSNNCCRDLASGTCYCNRRYTHSYCFVSSKSDNFVPVKASGDVSQCCGTLKQRSFTLCFGFNRCQVYKKTYQYWPTKLEQNGLCKRNPAVSWDHQYNSLPQIGGCTCKPEATSCLDSNVASTTTTTMIPTTTPVPVCPKPPVAITSRVLGGNAVGDSCSVDGIIKFNVGNTQICNGIMGFNPKTQSNQVYITDFCLGLLKAVSAAQQITAVGLYNSVPFEINQATTATSLGNSISLTAPPLGVVPKARCKTTACVYNPSTMSNLIDLNSCYIASYGYDYQLSGSTFNSGTVNKVDVTPNGSCKTTAVTPNAKCFTAVDSKVRGCWGDNGAPVFCTLTSTKETVLYGMVDVTGQAPEALTGSKVPDLCVDSNEFHVLPIA
ncbi:hypothetical protein ACOMHN_020936 [Nucella lapillus]